jgi:hypothetical protein
MKKKEGILLFHQGWTDIINCLALINYYCNIYDKIYLIIREESKELINFYTNNITNLCIFYEELQNIDSNNIHIANKYTNVNFQNTDFLVNGMYDFCRKDNYINKFKSIDGCFVKRFYESYDIPYITRINKFEFNRNYKLEEEIYQNFINLYGNDYILYHEIIENYDKDKKIVNLNGISNFFFDFIKILENAIEIHLLDSVWGSFVYQLDAKYNLFKNKKIFLYAKRGYRKMFEEPVKLNNWIIM